MKQKRILPNEYQPFNSTQLNSTQRSGKLWVNDTRIKKLIADDLKYQATEYMDSNIPAFIAIQEALETRLQDFFKRKCPLDTVMTGVNQRTNNLLANVIKSPHFHLDFTPNAQGDDIQKTTVQLLRFVNDGETAGQKPITEKLSLEEFAQHVERKYKDSAFDIFM